MTEHRISTGAPLPQAQAGTSVSRPSAVTYRLGGRSYPMVTDSRCKGCQSEHRVHIERMSLRGYGPTPIHRSLPEAEQQRLSVRNIMDHCRAHLPVDHLVRQAILDARAREIGLDVEQVTDTIVDQISFARVGLQMVYERMADGEIRPSMSDGIAFARFLHDVDQTAGDAGQFDQDLMARGFMAYMRAVQKVCTPEQVRLIAQEIEADPVMASLRRRGEVVEVAAQVSA